MKRNRVYKRTCHFCHNIIEGRGYGDNRFCSKTCMGRYQYYTDIHKLDKTKPIYYYHGVCQTCGKEFKVYRSYRRHSTQAQQKYCSDECRKEGFTKRNEITEFTLSECSERFKNIVLQEVIVNGEDFVIEAIHHYRDVCFKSRSTFGVGIGEWENA